MSENKTEQKKGFFGKLFKKEDKDISSLREELGLTPFPTSSIQGMFEDQAAKELETSNTMPEETLDDAPLPPEELMVKKTPEPKPEEKTDLESELKKIKNIKINSSPVQFFLPDGSFALTLADLKIVLEGMSDDEYRRRVAENDFSAWASKQLHDESLALDMHNISLKKRMMEIIDVELGQLPKPTKAKIKKHDIELHFDTLSAEHKKEMEELVSLVEKSEASIFEKKQLKKHFILENKKLVDSLQNLIHALELMDEKNFKEAVEKDKESFAQWVQELAKKAVSANKLDAKKLQTQKEEFVHVAEDLKEQQEKLTELSDDINARRESLLSQQKDFKSQKERYRQEVASHHQEMDSFEKSKQTFIDKYEKRVAQLDAREEALLTHKRKEQELIEQRQKELNKKEMDLSVNFKDREELLNRKLREFDERKDSISVMEREFEKKKTAFDTEYKGLTENLKAREELVEQSLNRLMTIDKDITHKKEDTERLKEEIDHEGFKSYLSAKLKEVDENNLLVHHRHTSRTHQAYAHIYTLIDQCNDAIEEHNIERAKTLYDQLKIIYDKEKMPAEEKEIIYDAIRELYTSLHLALLEAQRR